MSTPEGTVLSVAPDCLEAVRAAGLNLEDVLEGLPEALGQSGGVVGHGVGPRGRGRGLSRPRLVHPRPSYGKLSILWLDHASARHARGTIVS